MREIKLFVSSPADVLVERQLVERVAERVSGSFHDALRISCVRWEKDRYYKADRTFQDQIPASYECDLVVCILWSRLGSELPPDFRKMPGGQPYPSGTAFELLTALEASKAKEIPDVIVYRKTAPAPVPVMDADERRMHETQLAALDAFWRQWFVSDAGHFTAAFHSFDSPEAFETQFEEHLRGWLNDAGLLRQDVTWHVEEHGSPFRGLETFDRRHASVFFGRTAAIGACRERLADAARRGCPFLVIVGESGSGKSSLARAGLLPRLTAPGTIADTDGWRTAVLQPGGDRRPLRNLADALFADGAIGAELGHGDFPEAAKLSRYLAGARDIAPIERALTRAAEALAAREGLDRQADVKLLLLIDQFEELFSADIDSADRDDFVAVLDALAAMGQIYIIATLRSDAYGLLLRHPRLAALKERGASYDLKRPNDAEIAEIIRAPARAAGLGFETVDGRGLDDVLLEDASDSDALPLLQFTLQKLFEARAPADDEAAPNGVLTGAAYEAMGGLRGAVGQAAEEAFASVSADARERLPRLVRTLTSLVDARKGTFSLVPGRIDAVSYDDAAKELVDALDKARVLVSGDREGDRYVRFAHEAVLREWPAGRDAVEDAATFLRVRDELAVAEDRWRNEGQRADLLLPAGSRLAEAEEQVRAFEEEVEPRLRGFVAASGRRARRRQHVVAVFAFVFAAIAGVAAWKWGDERRASAAAEQARQEAVETSNTLEDMLASKLTDSFRVPTEELGLVIRFTDQLFARLVAGVDSPDHLVRYARVLIAASHAGLERGQIRSAGAAAHRAARLLSRLSEQDRRRDGVPETIASIHAALARYYAATGEYTRVDESVRAVAALTRDRQDVPFEILIAANLAAAKAALGRHHFSKGLDAIERAQRELDARKDDESDRDLAEKAIEVGLLRVELLGAREHEAEAISHVNELQERIEALVQDAADDLRWRYYRCRALYLEGAYAMELNDLDRASQSLEAAEEEISELRARDGGNQRWRHLRAEVDAHRGTLFRRLRQWPHAEAVLKNAAATAHELRGIEPNWPAVRFTRSRATLELARTYLDRGQRNDQAAKALDDAAQTAWEWAITSPEDVFAQRSKYVVDYYKAELARKNEDTAAALEIYERSLNGIRQLAERAPDSPAVLTGVAFLEREAGRLHRELENHDAAREALEGAVAAWAALYDLRGRIETDNLTYVRIELADLLSDQALVDEARSQYLQARRELDAAIEQDGPTPELVNRRVLIDLRLARFHHREKDYVQAIDYFEVAAKRAFERLSADRSDDTAGNYLDFARERIAAIREEAEAADDLAAGDVEEIKARAARVLAAYNRDRLLKPTDYVVSEDVMVTEERQGWILAPFMPGIWYELFGTDFSETKDRVQQAATEADLDIDSITRIRASQVDFYPKALLLEAEVVREGRRGVAIFVAQEGEIYLLDGTSNRMHWLNEKARVRLDRIDRAAAYMRFFTGALGGKVEDGGRHRFIIVDGIEDLHFTGAVADKRRGELSRLIRPFVVSKAAGGKWQATVTVQYSNALFNAVLSVERNGLVTMHDDVTVAANLPVGRERFVGGIRFLEEGVESDGTPEDAQRKAQLAKIAELRETAAESAQNGEFGAAVATRRRALNVARSLYADGGMSGEDLAGYHGGLAYALLFTGDAAAAEAHSRAALELAPLTWIQTNLAHALMYQGRLQEADALYLGNRGKPVPGDQVWEQAILNDFKLLREAGHEHPHMQVVEAKLREGAG